MATIEIHGSETNVKVVESEREDGETLYELVCDKGAWCPQFSNLIKVSTINLVEAIRTAEIHADLTMHE